MITTVGLLAIYSRTVVRQFSYVRRSCDIDIICYSRYMAHLRL